MSLHWVQCRDIHAVDYRRKMKVTNLLSDHCTWLACNFLIRGIMYIVIRYRANSSGIRRFWRTTSSIRAHLYLAYRPAGQSEVDHGRKRSDDQVCSKVRRFSFADLVRSLASSPSRAETRQRYSVRTLFSLVNNNGKRAQNPFI